MQSPEETTTIDDVEKNKELVLTFYGTKDNDVRRDLLAPGLIGRSPGVPDFGRDGFLRGIADLMEAFPDGMYTNEDIVAEGDKVVTVGRFHGTHVNAFHGAPPTGQPVTFVAVHVDRIADGRIVEHLRISVPEEPVESGPARTPGPTGVRA